MGNVLPGTLLKCFGLLSAVAVLTLSGLATTGSAFFASPWVNLVGIPVLEFRAHLNNPSYAPSFKKLNLVKVL